MKLSKVTWFILIIGVAIIGAVGLYLVYDDEVDQQETLQASIDSAEAQLPVYAAQATSLEEQIAELEDERSQAEADLTEAENLFPTDVQSIYYGDVLFFWDRVFEMRVIDFTATEPFLLKVGNISYEATTFTITVETDDVDAIMAYLTTLENDPDFESTVIDSSSIIMIQQDPETEEVELNTADISITILSYGGN